MTLPDRNSSSELVPLDDEQKVVDVLSSSSPAGMTIPVCVDDGAAIVRVIREHHAAWKLAQGGPSAGA